MIRRDMEGRQTSQKVAGWVLFILGGGVLLAITGFMLASVLGVIEFPPLSTGLRVFLGIFVLAPILAFDFWLIRQAFRYRQSRKWLTEYERENPLPYRTDQD